MTDEIQLISDGDGLAVIGPPEAVERFLMSEGLVAKDLELQRLLPAIGTAAVATRVGAELTANSGRWVKLTKESVGAIKKYGLMTNGKTGLKMGVVQAKGQAKGIKSIVQFSKGPGAMLTSPALLSGAAGIMAQYAMQQSMDEIADYLAVIDEKVDDLLRGQRDAVLADMIGIDLVIDEAMTIRAHVGRVSEVSWSKVQTTSMTIARTQAYAIRQLDALAEKIERKTQVDEVAKASKGIATNVQQWLAVLAHCVRLQDAITVLELDRVLDASPEELDQHRLGVRANREKRLDLIARTTGHLLARLDAAAGSANMKVLLNPISARTVVGSSNQVGVVVVGFQERLGIDSTRQSVNARRWMEAVGDIKNKVIETGEVGVGAAIGFGKGTVGAAKDFGGDAIDRARSMTNKISTGVAERTHRPLEAGDENGKTSK